MILYNGKKPQYFDKNGVEIAEGCKIRFPDGRIEEAGQLPASMGSTPSPVRRLIPWR